MTSAMNKRVLGFGRPSRKERSHDAARMSLIGASSFQPIFTSQINPRNTSTISAFGVFHSTACLARLKRSLCGEQ